MANIINFADAKRHFDLSIISVGDLVEWRDFNDELYEGVVESIAHNTLEDTEFSGEVECFPLWEKREYVVHFRDGMQVVGDIIERKILRKEVRNREKVSKSSKALKAF